MDPLSSTDGNIVSYWRHFMMTFQASSYVPSRRRWMLSRPAFSLCPQFVTSKVCLTFYFPFKTSTIQRAEVQLLAQWLGLYLGSQD